MGYHQVLLSAFELPASLFNLGCEAKQPIIFPC